MAQSIDYAAISPYKMLYSNDAKHIMDEIVGDGSPASPARPGRRHVAQVLGHRGQVSYRNVSKFGDVFGSLRKPQYVPR